MTRIVILALAVIPLTSVTMRRSVVIWVADSVGGAVHVGSSTVVSENVPRSGMAVHA